MLTPIQIAFNEFAVLISPADSGGRPTSVTVLSFSSSEQALEAVSRLEGSSCFHAIPLFILKAPVRSNAGSADTLDITTLGR